MPVFRPLRLNPLLATLCLGIAGPAAVLAAPAPFPTVTTPVKLDGQLLATQNYEWLNTIVYDNGTYHLWYLDAALSIHHATSSDGISFTHQNAVTLPANWWTPYGATTEPQINYLRVSRDGAGNWILMAWHPNGAGHGQFNYNTSLWLLGSGIANPAPTLIGPLPSQPGGNHVGALGIVGSSIYLAQDTADAFGRYALNTPIATTSPPVTTPSGSMFDAADAFAGTPWCSFADAGCASADRSYIHNYGRTLDQGNVLGTYYSLRDYNTWTRREKQLWYLESADGGATWSTAAQPLFANGDAVTVDGLPNTGPGFSNPEVAALGGGQYRTYFNTYDACGNNVVVTAALPGTQRGLTVAKAFSPSTVAPGGTSQLTVTLTAPAATCTGPTTPAAYTGLGFTDTLPTGMTVAATPNASTNCPGAAPFNPAAGAGHFALAGITLAPGASCTATVAVTVAGAGTFRNTISAALGERGAITNDQGVPALADAVAELRAGVAPAAVPTMGEYAMAALTLLLATLGVRRLRPASRRKN